MYVCHCRAITDGQVRQAIDDGARTPRDLARSCGAGSKCRGCWPALWALLDQEAGIWSPEYQERRPLARMLAG